MTTPTERRTSFWRPFIDRVWMNDPDDGHEHDFQLISPKSLGTFGPTGVVCVHCGWFRAWGKT